MNRFIMCVIVLLAASSPSSVWSADENKKTTGDDKTDRKMVELQKKSKHIETCAAQVSTLIRIEDEEVTISGPGFFKGPGKMKIEKSLPDGSAQLVINDGSTLWIHDQTENLVSRINLARVYQVTRIEADADQFDPLRPFRGVDWSTIRYTGDETVAGTVYAVFDAKPLPTLLFAQLPAAPALVRLHVHAGDGLLRQARIYDAEDNEIIVQDFQEVQGNRELEDRLFEFVVPAGAHPMDATSDVIAFFKSIE